MKAQKDEIKEFTNQDALRLLHDGGEFAPSHDRINVTRRVLNLCASERANFAHWKQPLYPAFDWCDMEFPMLVEEEWDIAFDDAAFNETPIDTFGGLVCFVETSVAFVRNRLAGEKAQIANAPCATQTAFYVLRRRLLYTGTAFYQVHGLRPHLPLADLPNKRAETLARSISKDYEFPLSLRRVLWSCVDTGKLQWAFFVLSVLFCVFAAFASPAAFWGGTLLCLLMNIAFGCLVYRHSRYKWPRDIQTLGDLARKIAEIAAPSATAQAAQS